MPNWAVAVVWLLLGGAVGLLIRWGSVQLARLEELDPGSAGWQVWGPPALCAVLFAVFGFQLGWQAALLVRSLWVAVLVQIIFFDLEHRLILDRVSYPAMLLAFGLGFVTFSGWTPHLDLGAGVEHLLTGLAAGVAFLLLAVIGALIFKTEALGFGDVKLALLIGLMLGMRRPETATLRALFYGIVLAGVASLVMILARYKRARDFFAYGPYLAAGTLVVLFQVGQ
jgi:leader peptidase (prepilin peptidase)/N-methyltransferase